MPRDFSRARRVGDQIQQELAGLIRDQVRDPRVGSVTVSEVRVSRDFSYADVFVTGLGMEPDESREMVRVLTGAGNFLRRELAQRLTLRKVPLLRFQYDPTFDRGARLNRLIDDVQPDDDPTAPDPD